MYIGPTRRPDQQKDRQTNILMNIYRVLTRKSAFGKIFWEDVKNVGVPPAA